MIGEPLTLREAKERLDVSALWPLLNLPGEPRRSICCPFHEDRAASFSVYPGSRGTLRWKCFAGCGEGGPVELLSLALDISVREACCRLLEMARGERYEPSHAFLRPRPTSEPAPERELVLPADLHAGSCLEVRQVANRRGLSLSGVQLAQERGLLGFATTCGSPAWIVIDRTRVNAQARRMDGLLFAATHKLPERKAHTLGGSWAPWPIGTQEAAGFTTVLLVEGAPDLLAAHHFIVAESREQDVAAAAVLGASNYLPDDALQVLTGKRVRLFPHLDPKGQAAAVRWAKQLEGRGCQVDAFDFSNLPRMDGQPVKDLNDLALLDADAYEAERAQLERILP